MPKSSSDTNNNDHQRRAADVKPVPDPTELTARAVKEASEIARQENDALQELLEQKIKANGDKIDIGEKHRLEQKGDTAEKIKAAFDAQSAAAQKAEANFNELIKSLNATMQEGFAGLRRDIDSVKERVTVIESSKAGAKEDRTSLFATINVVGFVVLLVIAVIGFLATGN